MHETDDGVELELRPRFPLFGGWKTNYYIGYNVPSYQYLYHSGQSSSLSSAAVVNHNCNMYECTIDQELADAALSRTTLSIDAYLLEEHS